MSRVRLFLTMCFAWIALIASGGIARSDDVVVTMFLVPERTICSGRKPFTGCTDVNDKTIGSFLQLMHSTDPRPIEFKVPPEDIDLTSNDDRNSVLMSLTAIGDRYRESGGAIPLTAAVFFLDLPKGEQTVVSFTRNSPMNGLSDLPKVTYTPGRYVTWVNAADVDPNSHASFDLSISGLPRSFRFRS